MILSLLIPKKLTITKNNHLSGLRFERSEHKKWQRDFTIFVFQINKGLDRQYPSAIDSEAIEPLSVLHIIELGAI